MERIVGIDLGTSTSCLALVQDGEVVVCPDGRGNRVTPSYIHIMEDGRILVGPQAKAEVISDPYSTIWATKRLIGRRYNEEEVQAAKQYFGYDISPAEDGSVLVKGRDKELSPTEVGAIILKYLTRLGRKVTNDEIKKTVLTVPAYFTDPQRKATREAGTMIGLDVVRLINEPTAAALAYGYDSDVEETIAMFDLGGGTFDLSILSIGQGVFEVVATDGDSWLGGEDFDNRLVDYLAKDFQKKFKINVFNDKMAHQRVKDAAERTKVALSTKDEVEVNLPALCPDVNRWAGIETTVTKKIYDGLVMDLVDRTLEIFKRLLKDAGMTVHDLDNIILVGGMTRMPLVRKKVADFIEREPDTSLNPDESVAVGAAIHAASLSGEKLLRKKKPAKEAPPPKARPAAIDLDRTTPGTPAPELLQDMTKPGIAAPEIAAPETISEVREPAPAAPSTQDLTTPGFPVEPVMSEPEPPSAEDLIPMDPSPEIEEAEMIDDEGLSADPESVDIGEGLPPQAQLDDFFAPPVEESRPGAVSDTLSAIPEAEEGEEPLEMDEADDHEEAGFQAVPPETPPDPDTICTTDESLLPADPDLAVPVGAPEMESAGEFSPGEVVDEADIGEEPPADADERPVSVGPIVRDYETAEPPAAAPMPDLSVPGEAPAGPEPEPAMPEPAEPQYYEAPILLDVLSQTVGLAHFGGHFVPIIKRFAKLPARATQVFTTCVDNQRRIKVSVLQGENKYVKENTPLGEFVLAGIEKARRGVPQIEVSFDIDQNGIFVIGARDLATGVAQEIKLEGWAKSE